MFFSKTFLICFLISLIFGYSHVIKQNEKSRVLEFKYRGFGDSTSALILGTVYSAGVMDKMGKSRLYRLADVKIQVQQNNKITTTDAKGNFIIGFDKGVFSLLITKESYQPLRITNYISNPDQVSNAMIILEKGSELQTFEIPKP